MAIGLFVLVLGALVVGAVLGQPILFSFVETGSMAPTLEPGDGFVAIPAEVAPAVGEGSVVVFEAQHIEGGGLVTHRIVGETADGYITHGDANPFTDQDGGEPPVTDGQIVAVALQVRGEVLAIPYLGHLVWAVQGTIDRVQWALASAFDTRLFLGAQGQAILLGALGVVVVLYGLLTQDAVRRVTTRRRRRATGWRPLHVLVAMAAVLVLVAGGTMFVMSDTHEYGMISAEFESANPTTVPVGETSTVELTAINGGLLPVFAVYEPASARADVEPGFVRLDRGGEAAYAVTLTAPETTGYYPQYVSEHRYFAVLPADLVQWLHGVHPLLATLATSLVFGLIVLIAGAPFLDGGRIRTRTRSRT